MQAEITETIIKKNISNYQILFKVVEAMDFVDQTDINEGKTEKQVQRHLLLLQHDQIQNHSGAKAKALHIQRTHWIHKERITIQQLNWIEIK